MGSALVQRQHKANRLETLPQNQHAKLSRPLTSWTHTRLFTFILPHLVLFGNTQQQYLESAAPSNTFLQRSGSAASESYGKVRPPSAHASTPLPPPLHLFTNVSRPRTPSLTTGETPTPITGLIHFSYTNAYVNHPTPPMNRSEL